MFAGKMKKLIIVVDENTKAYGELLSALITLKDDTEESVIGVKDGSVEAVVWDEKVYQSNAPQLSSTNKIVFIGSTKAAQPIMTSISFANRFDKHGIYIGALGNKAVIYVDKNEINSANKYNSFITDYSDYISGFASSLITSQNVDAIKFVDQDDLEVRREEVAGRINALVGKGFKGLNKGLAGIQKAISVDEENEIAISKDAANKTASFINKTVNSAWSTKAAERISFDIMNAKSSKEMMDQQYRCAVIAFYAGCLSKFME